MHRKLISHTLKPETYSPDPDASIKEVIKSGSDGLLPIFISYIYIYIYQAIIFVLFFLKQKLLYFCFMHKYKVAAKQLYICLIPFIGPDIHIYYICTVVPQNYKICILSSPEKKQDGIQRQISFKSGA
jgi:hypothetical protein